MQGGQHQMAGLGRLQGQFDGFEVAHFPDQDDVGVLAQGAAQGGREGARVAADFALVDEAAGRGVQVFDGVLDGDDVIAPVLVGVADHGGQGGGLARAGGAGDEHEPPGPQGQFGQQVGQRKFGQARHGLGNGPEGGGQAPFLAEIVGPETADARRGVGEVQVAGLLEGGDQPLGSDFVEQGGQFLLLQDLVLDALQPAGQAHQGLGAGGEVQVRGSGFLEHFKEGVDLGHGVLGGAVWRLPSAGLARNPAPLESPSGSVAAGTAFERWLAQGRPSGATAGGNAGGKRICGRWAGGPGFHIIKRRCGMGEKIKRGWDLRGVAAPLFFFVPGWRQVSLAIDKE